MKLALVCVKLKYGGLFTKEGITGWEETFYARSGGRQSQAEGSAPLKAKDVVAAVELDTVPFARWVIERLGGEPIANKLQVALLRPLLGPKMPQKLPKGGSGSSAGGEDEEVLEGTPDQPPTPPKTSFEDGSKGGKGGKKGGKGGKAGAGEEKEADKEAPDPPAETPIVYLVDLAAVEAALANMGASELAKVKALLTDKAIDGDGVLERIADTGNDQVKKYIKIAKGATVMEKKVRSDPTPRVGADGTPALLIWHPPCGLTH